MKIERRRVVLQTSPPGFPVSMALEEHPSGDVVLLSDLKEHLDRLRLSLVIAQCHRSWDGVDKIVKEIKELI